MFNKRSLALGIVLGLMTVLATPASANNLQTATATANCQGYNLSVFLKFLTVGQSYTVDYNFTLICNGGTPVQVPGAITFVASARSQTVTASGTFSGLVGSCTVSGTVFVASEPKFVKSIVINGVLVAPLTCVTPPTANCAVIDAEQGVPITPVTLAASGGAGPPYTFTATGLPTGLTISPSGTISGTPTVNGTFNYTVTITDSAGNVGTINCSVTVKPPPQLTCLASGTTGEVGVPFSSGPLTVTGGTAPYTFSVVGTLPAGLTLNTSTGAISGTPTAAGSFSIQVTDAKGVTATTTCPYTIVPAPQLTCLASGTTGEVGVPFSSGPLTVTGGTAPYTFSVVGTLPAGLTLNTSTGAISGTPTAAGSFSIQVTDAKGVTATTTCPYTIVPAPQLTCLASGTTGEVGVPFSSGPLTVTGGTAPYTFSVVGTLPAGLTLNTSTGAISGTPTAAGSFSIKVTDAKGVTATTTCPYTIVPGLNVTCYGTSTGTVGIAFDSGPMGVTGGTPPYTFSVSSGTLPPGLTLNPSNGEVTGTPTAPGTFAIKVTDSLGAMGTGCTITINPTRYVCVIPPSGTEISGDGTSWNKFNPQGSSTVVWINMHIGKPSGVPTNAVNTVQFTGVQFVLNGTTYDLPDGFLVFDPSAPAIPTTSFNPAFSPNGAWTTTFNPNNLSDEMFFDGQAVPVDANISGGGKANIFYTTESTDNNLAFSWQWSAAAYTYWPDNNTSDILPYHKSLHAGTPQNKQVQQSLIQGPRGGGGSNYTGSWSATGNGACPGAQ